MAPYGYGMWRMTDLAKPNSDWSRLTIEPLLFFGSKIASLVYVNIRSDHK